MPRVRRVGNLIFANLVSLISAERITDSASGMRVFKKSVLKQLYPLPDGLNLTPVMSTRALHEQLRMIEVPIPYRERVGQSKLSVARDGLRFAQSIVWTALNYNPARILALIGSAALALAAMIAAGVVMLRLQGVTTLSPVGGFMLFAGLVLAVSGVTLLGLGVSFNYFVALFQGRSVPRGAFGRAISRYHLDQYLGGVGLGAFLLALVVAATSLVLGSQGWNMQRLWFYYLVSASLALVGVQLMVAWVQMQVLDALRARDNLVLGDMKGHEVQIVMREDVKREDLMRDDVKREGAVVEA